MDNHNAQYLVHVSQYSGTTTKLLRFEFKYTLIRTNSFSHEASAYSFCKILSNNLNPSFSNISSDQIDFCFSGLYFGLLTQTKVESINKQLLVEVSFLNKAV